MKTYLVALLIASFVGMLFVGLATEVPASQRPSNTNGSEHAEPKIKIKAGTKMPDGTILTESVATGGTVYGTLEADNLTVYGTISVDGQVLVGNRMWCPLGNLVVKSAGNRSPEPDKPTLTWKDVEVRGSLTVHGSLIVHGNLTPLGNMSIAGMMGPSCRSGRVLFRAGAYPIATALQFGCPQR